MSDDFTATLQSKIGYHPYLYVKLEKRDFHVESWTSARKYVLGDWSKVKDGDEVFVVGEGMKYHGYIGKWNTKLNPEEWEHDSGMLHNQPYIPGEPGDLEFIGDVIQVVKKLDQTLYIELLEYFGFEMDHERYRLSDKIESLIDKHPEHFRQLQIIHACLC